MWVQPKERAPTRVQAEQGREKKKQMVWLTVGEETGAATKCQALG